MPTIDSTVLINAPLERVYAIAQDNRSFPDFMDDVKSLTVLEEDGPRIVSEWHGVIPAFGLKIKWTQEDLWDHDKHRCAFTQIKGDYDAMAGYWEFRAEADGVTRFDSHVEYEYNVPALGALVKKVVHNLATKNVEGLLNAIKKRAETV